MSTRIVVDTAWMRRAAREIDRAADEAAAGNADMKWLLGTDISGPERAKLAAAYRSTRSVPEALRAVSRSLGTRAAVIDLSEQMVWSGAADLRRISMPKWLQKRILKIAKDSIKITGLIRKFVDQAQDYAHLADKAKNGVFWGNFCGAGNKGKKKTPTDTLDACCKAHDAAYDKLKGITPTSQFTPAGLMKTAAANAALSKCAKRQPDGTESGDTKRFDPGHVNKLDIRGDDARSGVMKLFGLMSEIGYALKAAETTIKKKIEALGISAKRAKEMAEWALQTAAKEILDSYADRFGELGTLA